MDISKLDKSWRGKPRKPKPNTCAKCGGETVITKKYGVKARKCKNQKKCGAVVRTVGK